MWKTETKILAVDIETSGPSLKSNGILAIGICLGDLRGNVDKKERINVCLEEEHCFDDVCLSNFWNKPGPSLVLRTIQIDPLTPKDAIQKFVSILDEYDRLYNLTIVSDNPTFDFYFLSYYMDKYLCRKPLNYKFGKTYRNLVDTCSFSRGHRLRSGDKRLTQNMSKDIKHDHLPENDAEYIYTRYVGDYKQCSRRQFYTHQCMSSER